MSGNLVQVALSILAPAVLAAIGAVARVLTARGALAAFIVGAVVAVCAPVLFPALLLMVVLGVGATRLRVAMDARRGIARGTDGVVRGAGSVVGNGGVAALAAMLYGVYSDAWLERIAAVLFLAAAGAIAAATSDTVASEFGRAVRGRTFLLTTGKPVEPGANGGVSLAGSVAGIVVSAVVAASVIAPAILPYEWLRFFSDSMFERMTCGWSQSAISAIFAIIVLAGVVGNIIDSLVGATLEGKRLGFRITETRSLSATLGNNEVNILCTLAGAIVAASFAAMICW